MSTPLNLWNTWKLSYSASFYLTITLSPLLPLICPSLLPLSFPSPLLLPPTLLAILVYPSLFFPFDHEPSFSIHYAHAFSCLYLPLCSIFPAFSSVPAKPILC